MGHDGWIPATWEVDLTPSEQIERVVLGICADGDAAALEISLARVRPDYFGLDSHRRIWLAIALLAQGSHPVNAVTLMHHLSETRELQSIGGAAYLADLNTGVPANVGAGMHEYIGRLEEHWRRRELWRIGELMQATANEGVSSEQLVQRLSAQLEAIAPAPVSSGKFFAGAADFMTDTPEQIDWMVSGVIARGCNGFIAAEPKGAKSWNAADLAIALATGSSWLDFSIPRPVRVGLVSREDNPALTQWRLNHLRMGRHLSPFQLAHLDTNLYVNTRRQTPTLMLDNPREIDELIGAAKERRLEFILLDVLNVMHSADENDNTEMAGIMRKVRRVQDKTGAAIGILHHYNKADTAGRITQRLRGASAIAGFAEWVIGISLCDEESQMRCMSFEAKTGAPEPIYFCISANDQSARIVRVRPQNPKPDQAARRKGVN